MASSGRPAGDRRSSLPAAPPRSRETVRRAQEHLLGRQDAAGWWKGELATNVTMDAEDLLLRQFLGILDAGRPRAGRPLDPLAAARRRHLGQLLRRPGRPVHDDRGLRRAAAGRRRRRRRRTCKLAPRVHPGRRRHRGEPGVHPDLAGAVRRVVLGRPARDAARADPAAEVVPAQRLRLGLLGPPDRRADHGRRDPAPGPSAAVHADRAAHGRRRRRRARAIGSARAFNALDTRAQGLPPGAAAHPGRRGGDARGRRVDHRPAGGRRLLGRHPAALGVLDPRAAPARLRPRPPGRSPRRSTASRASSSARTAPTGRSGGSRPASRRSGTRAWP